MKNIGLLMSRSFPCQVLPDEAAAAAAARSSASAHQETVWNPVNRPYQHIDRSSERMSGKARAATR